MTDYHDFTNIDTPQSERRKLNVGDIWENGAQCLTCGDYVRSRNRHDYATCSCGNVSVDGGSWYAKRSFNGPYTSNVIPYNDVQKEN